MSSPSPLFKGIWIPFKLIEILKPRFSLISLTVNNYYFKKPLDVKSWKRLFNLGLSKKQCFSPEEIRMFVSDKSPQKINAISAYEICSWCNGSTYRLHSHHFPLPKREGGSKTVNICASCHDEYHFMSDGLYCLSDEVNTWFKEASND